MQLFEALEQGHVLDRPAADVPLRRPDRGLQLLLRLHQQRVRRLALQQDHRAHAEDERCREQPEVPRHLPEHDQRVQQVRGGLGAALRPPHRGGHLTVRESHGPRGRAPAGGGAAVLIYYRYSRHNLMYILISISAVSNM